MQKGKTKIKNHEGYFNFVMTYFMIDIYRCDMIVIDQQFDY